jgi:hypothetical protein
MDDRLIQDGIWEEGQGSATEVAVLHDRGPSDERSHTPAPSDVDADLGHTGSPADHPDAAP